MKKWISLCLALLLCAGLATPACAAGFSDVPAGHYAAGAIGKCVDKGVVSGYNNGTFRPNATLTRAQFCVMLSRAFFASYIEKYKDPIYISSGIFWANYQAMMANQALNNTSFADDTDNVQEMNRSISRYDMAQLITNIMTKQGFPASSSDKSAAIAKITDYNNIPSRYRDAVANVYALGIITGYADGSFGGTVTMNRAQGCVVIDRISAYVQSDTAPTEVKEWSPDPASNSQTPAQPTQPTQPAQPTGNPNLPEIRCASCGYLMRAAGSTQMDFNNGGAGGAFGMCDTCNVWYLCQQCAQYTADAGFELHRHQESCASGGTTVPVEDFYSPSYRGSLYYQQLKNVTLTGNYRQDILTVAASQIGYRGSSNSNQLDGSRGGGSHTEYNWALNFYGESDGAWCSEFASWCARQAKIPTSILHSSYIACPNNFGGTAHAWSDTVFAGGSYMPQPGDLMLICHSSRAVSPSDSMDHTTIVESVSQNGDRVTITVIDGNSNNSVRRHDYTYNASRGMTGFFVAPDYP